METNYQNTNSTNTSTSQDNQQTVPASINQHLNNPLKRNLKLEFNSNMDATNSQNNANKNAKRPKLMLPSASSLNLHIPVLPTPDLLKVTMLTPELDKYMQLTPGTPSQVLFSTNVEEQEQYTRSFEDAINDMKNNSNIGFQLKSEISEDMFDMTRCSSNSSSATYTTLDSSNPFPNVSSGFELNSSDGCSSVHIKDELSTSPPMSPINMESQERIKLERKRQRNRVAASKCRKRKLERIARLEDRVKVLKGENTELASLASKLKQQVCSLKEQVLEHVQNGCQIILTSQF